MKASILIVNWNTRQLLFECLASLRLNRPRLDHEIIVVDNASSDGSAEMVRDQFPEARLVKSPGNIGFGPANNLGMRLAQGKYLVLINSDTLVLAGAVDRLVDFMEGHPGLAAAGGLLYTGDGRVQRSVMRHASLLEELRAIIRPGGMPERDERYYRREHLGVQYVSGAFLGFRREALSEVGFFDEGFFMYAEESDLCLRLRRAGYQVGYTPAARVVHWGGASSASANAYVLQLVSRLRFVRKHHPAPVYQFRRVLTTGLVLLRWCMGRWDQAFSQRLIRAIATLSYRS